MRRAFVIFLILLFPLNVFALSMSVSAVQQAAAPEASAPSTSGDIAADAFDNQVIGDPDSDEPPSGTDFHDSVHSAGPLHYLVPPDGAPRAQLLSRRGLSAYPPIKPPPVH